MGGVGPTENGPATPLWAGARDTDSAGRSKIAFVSTAIPYVNARPHVGFAFELIQADVIARYLRRRGYETCSCGEIAGIGGIRAPDRVP